MKRSPPSFENNDSTYAVVGRSAVAELLNGERDVDKLFIQKGELKGAVHELVAKARAKGIPVVAVDKAKLDAMAAGAAHQGVAAYAAALRYAEPEELVERAKQRGEVPLLLALEGITDHQNLGAIIRSAECAGAHGILIPKRRAAGVSAAAAKAAAGALEHLPVAKVSNMNDALQKLQEQGLWVFSADRGGQPVYQCDLTLPAVIVIGGEDSGVSRLTRERSDFVAELPMYGHTPSLNASVAAALMLYEAVRQRHFSERG